MASSSTPLTPPLIDSRGYDQLVAQIEGRIRGNTAVAMSGVTPLVTLTGAVLPLDPILVTCTTAGALGTSEFTFAVGTGTASPPILSYVTPWVVCVPGTQVQLSFDDRGGTFELGDTFSVALTGVVTAGPRNAGGLAWTQARAGKVDVAGTLVRIFARMMGRVIERLNQVPEQHHLAFLGLLGAERLPPQPARAPLTFTPAAGGSLEPLVPARSQVAAPAEGELPEVLFHTERDLVLTRAALLGAFVRWPDADRYTDVTEAALTGAGGAFRIATAGNLAPFDALAVDHALYVACDPVWGRAGIVDLLLVLAFASSSDAVAFSDLPLAWSTGLASAPTPLGVFRTMTALAISRTSTTRFASPVTVLLAGPSATSVADVTYTLSYNNDGAVDATGVTLTDTVPAGATNVSATGGGVYDNGVVTWDLGTVNAGDGGSVTVTATLPSAGTFVNQARATFSLSGVAGSADAFAARTVYTPPAIALTTSVPASTAVPSVMVTINYSNPSSEGALNVVLNLALPPFATFQGGSTGVSFANRTVSWNLRTLNPGATGSVNATIGLGGQGSYTQHAFARYTQNAEPAVATSPISPTSTTNFLGQLVVVSTSGPTDTSSATVTYSVSYTNSGAGLATGFALYYLIPPGATFVSATGGGSAGGGVVAWNVGNVAVGVGGTQSVTLTLLSPGTFFSYAEATCTIASASRFASSNTVATVYRKVALTLTASAPATVAAPQMTSTVAYANPSAVDTASSVVIIDTLPAGTTFVSATGNGVHANGVVAWTVGSVAPGGVGSFDVTCSLPEAGSYTHQARATFTLNGASPSVTYLAHAPFSLIASSADGDSALWLRASLAPLPPRQPGQPDPPAFTAATAKAEISRTALAPDACTCNGSPLDLSKDFQPFGPGPRLYDVFHLNSEALATPSAQVTLRATTSDALWAGSPTAGASLLTAAGLVLAWEVWTGAAWTALSGGQITDGTGSFTFNASTNSTRTILLNLPSTVTATTVNGQTGGWLRVRLIGGSYGALDTALGTPAPAATGPAGATTWSYVVYAVGAAGISGAGAASVATVATLNATSYATLSWPVIANATSYLVYRTAGGATASFGFIGSTTSTIFVDTGQPAGSAPAMAGTPARPSLKALTIDYVTIASAPLVSNASTRPVMARSLNDLRWQRWTDPAVAFRPLLRVADGADPGFYLAFDRAPSNREISLFLDVDPPNKDEVEATDDATTPPAPPAIIWEYARPDGGFVSLGAADDTLALDRGDQVRFLGPLDFQPSVRFGTSAWWIRARIVGSFATARRLRRVLTNTVWATAAATVDDEVLGSSTGTGGLTLRPTRQPVLPGERIEVREPERPTEEEREALERALGSDVVTVLPASGLAGEEIWVRWRAVPDFYASLPSDRHYVIDRITGVVTFGDGKRGRIPPAGAQNVRASYRSGGAGAGNRAAGAITALKSAIPQVDGVTNFLASSGGADAEALARLKTRSGANLRHGGRAVTAQDFEDLALTASQDVARARAIGPWFIPAEQTTPLTDPAHLRGAGRALVVIVPWSGEGTPVPSYGLIATVRDFLVARSLGTVHVEVAGPSWSWVNVTAQLVPSSSDAGDRVRSAALALIDAFLHPLTGNFDGNGWEFGRQPYASDLYRLLATVPDLASIRSLSLHFDDRSPALGQDALFPTVGNTTAFLDDGTGVATAIAAVAPLPDSSRVARSLIFPGEHLITLA